MKPPRPQQHTDLWMDHEQLALSPALIAAQHLCPGFSPAPYNAGRALGKRKARKPRPSTAPDPHLLLPSPRPLQRQCDSAGAAVWTVPVHNALRPQHYFVSVQGRRRVTARNAWGGGHKGNQRHHFRQGAVTEEGPWAYPRPLNWPATAPPRASQKRGAPDAGQQPIAPGGPGR